MKTNKTQDGYAVGVTRQGEEKVFEFIYDTLFCSGENLISLDLSNAKGVKHVYCHSNAIETLSLSGLTKLEFLECHNNPLPPCNQEGKDWIIKRAKAKLRIRTGLCGCLQKAILDYNKRHDCCISSNVTDTFPKFTRENAMNLFYGDCCGWDYWWRRENKAIRLEFLDFINS